MYACTYICLYVLNVFVFRWCAPNSVFCAYVGAHVHAYMHVHIYTYMDREIVAYSDIRMHSYQGPLSDGFGGYIYTRSRKSLN